MKLFKLLFTLLIISIISGCSSSQESTSNDKLPEPTLIPTQTSSSHLEIKIPIGWREIKDNKDQFFDIWLVNNENKAVIAFIPIYLTDNLIKKTEDEKLELIEKIVINKKKSSVDNFEIVDQKKTDFYANSKSLKLRVENSFQNSIIYGNGKNYYECLAYFSDEHSPDESEISTLINIQENIVKDSKIK